MEAFMPHQNDDTISPLRRAKILFASGRLEESIRYFTIAEEKESEKLDIWLSRGAVHMALGKYIEASKDFSRVLADDPQHERAHYFRGVAQVALGKYEQGIADLTSSLIKNNNRGIAHLIRGLAYAELGQKADAILDINSASAFSEAEYSSFHKLFGDRSDLFQNSRALLTEENAPWNNLLSRESASTLLNLLQ